MPPCFQNRKDTLRPDPVRIPHSIGASLCGSSEATNISGGIEFNYNNFSEKKQKKGDTLSLCILIYLCAIWGHFGNKS